MKLMDKRRLATSKMCYALDGLQTLNEVENRIMELRPFFGMYKVGLESYTRFGTRVIDVVHNLGEEVFLDMKYHDIPETVARAARAAAALQVYMFSVHALGGVEMMRAAREGANNISISSGRAPKIVAATILTSMNRNEMNKELRIRGSLEYQISHLAKIVADEKRVGLDGIVCAAKEISYVKPHPLMPEKFMYVVTGIKGPNTEAGADQKRVSTAGEAIQRGADILVIGRAVTDASSRVQAAYDIRQEIIKYMKVL